MARKWTDAQLKAIETKNKTVLVSATAGSGKTTTLTERIIQSLTNEASPADLSKILVVTFTRASAADMKKKISDALSDAVNKNPHSSHLANQMMLLESAKISTIDSFYYDMVQSNAASLGIPETIRIADESEMSLLYRTEMENTIEEMYKDDASFSYFMENFSTMANIKSAVKTFISVYQNVLSYQEGIHLLCNFEEKLRIAATQPFFDTDYGKHFKKQVSDALEHIGKILDRTIDCFTHCDNAKVLEKYMPAVVSDRKTVIAAKAALAEDSYTKAKEIFDRYVPVSLGRGSVGDIDYDTKRYKDMRAKEVKDKLIDIRKNYFFATEDELSKLIMKTADITNTLYHLLERFEKRILKEKMAMGVCDFADIRRFALQLTVDENGAPTELADSYRERFDHIYIDEYQDVDEVQDLIFRAIARPKSRFMVGDIKQSIYSFRGANPSVFAGYKGGSFPLLGTSTEEDENVSIFMSDNFRCDKPVIDFSNLIFRYLFSHCGENIGYTVSDDGISPDDLVFSKDMKGRTPKKVVLALTANEEKKNDKKKQDEPAEKRTEEEALHSGYDQAVWIATEIQRLIRDEKEEFDTDEKKKGHQKFFYKDITVMIRSNTDLPILEEVFEHFYIPCQCREKINFFENPDVLLMLSFLNTIDNPHRDISLAGTLRSPFFGFTMDELIAIRQGNEKDGSLYDNLLKCAEEDTLLAKKCQDFLAVLTRLRHKAMTLPASKLLKSVYREMSVMSLSGSRSANLLRLYEYARSYEGSVFKGLSSFISYVNELIERDTLLESDGGTSGIDAVSIVTIHKSKGLEYPVCFLYGIDKKFNDANQENLKFDARYGIGLKLCDTSGFGKLDTPIYRTITDQKHIQNREEEMRILYVALTRAVERLYLVAAVSDPEKLRTNAENRAEFSSSYSIGMKTNCYIDWITAAIHNKPTNDFLTVVEVPKINTLPKRDIKKTDEEEIPEADQRLLEILKERFAFQYPYKRISEIPAKISVSKLHPRVLDETEELTLSDETFLLPDSLIGAEQASGAEKGTATHTVLQFCNFEFAEKYGIREEIERLCEHRFIDPNMAKIVNTVQLEKFFRSSLYKRIKNAKKLWREQRFNILLPAAEFTEEKELFRNETVAVQGVIDLFFEDENGNIVLVDYKTDYLTPEELRNRDLAAKKLIERHSKQLSYYEKAIEQMCGKKPIETLIYSLPLANTLTL